MTDRRILPAVLVAAGCAIGLMWLTEIPLGIVGPPYEWVWERIAYFENNVGDAVLGAIVAGAVGLVYLVLVAVGDRWMNAPLRVAAFLWLLLLVVAGFFWLLAVQESPPSPHGLSKIPWSIYYKGPSGYYFAARYEMPDAAEFLEYYQARITRTNDPDRVLHIGTHPPGLFLAYRGSIEAVRRFPAMTSWLESTMPPSVSAGFDSIATSSAGSSTALEPLDRHAIWLAALLTQLVASATVVPLYAILRRSFSPRTAWRAAAFWPLAPALAVFVPSSDVLHPFFGMSFLALWLAGRQRRSAVLCALSGAVFWIGTMLSLAVLPYALLAAFLTVWEVWRCDASPRNVQLRGSLLCVVWSLLGFFVPIAAMGVAFNLNLPRVWLTNFHNHADFYTQYSRTYWKWLLANPIELAFALGAPLAVLAAGSALCTLRQRRVAEPRLVGLTIGCLAVWGLLWISGKNMGEAARLWIVMQPWAVLLAAAAFGNGDTTNASCKPLSTIGWGLLLMLQMLVCLATVMRVTGFNFTGG